MFGRRAVLPIDIDICQDSGVKSLSYVKNEPEYAEDSQDTVLKSNIAILEEAKLNILQAQKKQKEHYDKKHANPLSYSISTKVIWRNQRTRKLRFVNFWISFRGTFHRECMAFILT